MSVLLDYFLHVPLCLVYLIVDLSDTWREEAAEYEISVFDPTLEELHREEQIRFNHINFDSAPRRDIILTDESYFEDYLESQASEHDTLTCGGPDFCAECDTNEYFERTLSDYRNIS